MTLNVYMTFENGITPARGFESRFHHYLNSEWECITPARGFESKANRLTIPYDMSITPARGFESDSMRLVG